MRRRTDRPAPAPRGRHLTGSERVRAGVTLAEAMRLWRDRLDRGELLTGLGTPQPRQWVFGC